MRTKLVIPVVAQNIDAALEQAEAAQEYANVIEFRADYIQDLELSDIEKFKNAIKRPVIFTCRPEYEKGHFSGTEKEREKFIEKALDSGYEYVDVEYKSDFYQEIISKTQNSRIILSYHNFDRTPSYNELQKLLDKMRAYPPHLIKIITTANTINDNFNIFQLLEDNQEKDIISFCMGVYGIISRALSRKFGSYLSFAALNEESKSAQGQINVKEMMRIYNFSGINSKTKVLGVAGEFAENSKSKYLHNPVFQSLNKNYVYLPFKVEPGDDLKQFMSNFRDYEFAGMAVTIPHKEKIMKYMDEVDDTAEAIGAVNTVVRQNNKLIGYNTDFVGAINALERKIELANKSCLVIGAGGASRAVVYGLINKSVNVTITNRTRVKAERLGAEFGCDVIDFEDRDTRAGEFDIIINTTSVGMYPDTDSSILENFSPDTLVMDIVYNPLRTKFIQLAEEAGCPVITGEKMLVYQAIKQSELWTGERPGFEQMHQAFFNIPE